MEQFRALADQLFRNPDYHKHIRKEVVKQLKHFRKLYEGYVPMKYKNYLKKMKKSGEWGDHVTLQAAADRNWYLDDEHRDDDVRVDRDDEKDERSFVGSDNDENPAEEFAAKICLVTSFRDTCFIEINPKENNPSKGKNYSKIMLPFHYWHNINKQASSLYLALIYLFILIVALHTTHLNSTVPVTFQHGIYGFYYCMNKPGMDLGFLKAVERTPCVLILSWSMKLLLKGDLKLWLSFWSEVHYNSLYASGDVPARVHKRRHWLF
ncbi:hypothetical protein RJ641_015671 [Dillenia turbinata]|uniref:Uncharacterized protein n=1 Tax=Dillenia turbinata TaxID=194707 RepID=A0AAN8V2H0_9MAGN